MSSKLSPCVAVILCVAGCNPTEPLEMPQTSSIGPPNFDKPKQAKRRSAPAQPIPKTAKLSLPDTNALRTIAQPSEALPNTYIASTPAEKKDEPMPFSPIRRAETAVAMSSPMPDAVAPTPLDLAQAVDAQPDPYESAQATAPAGQYIHIGMLWPEDAPVETVSRSFPAEIVSGDGRYRVEAAPLAPVRAALPVSKPIETVAIAPQTTPVPRAVAAPPEIETAALPPVPAEVADPYETLEPVQTAIVVPAPPAPPVLTEAMLTDASALAPLAEISRTEAVAPPVRAAQPLPDTTRMAKAPDRAVVPPDAALSPGDCFVSRGSNERMILVCEGKNISQSQVFRAVTEGESAFRGLRPFDSTERVIGTYGFNASRFHAMSRGPRSERDVTFLRALRRSRRSVQIKGRPFDMYLMKGDRSLATVLVEQAMAPERTAVSLAN